MKQNNQPAVYTIILNWNQPDDTLECIESLKESNYPANTIILVDNGSSDGSPEVIQGHHPDVTLLQQTQNLGFCESNNIGIQYALAQGADYVFLLNNDTIVASDMLCLLVESLEADSSAGMAGPTMFYYEDPNIIAAAGSLVNNKTGQFWNRLDGSVDGTTKEGEFLEVDFIVSCGVIVKREVIEKIGLLDNRYFINGDDIDWGLRVQAAGYKVIYVPEAKMWHKISAAMGAGSPATTYYITRNAYLTFTKHLKGIAKLRVITLITARNFRLLAAWTVKPKYRHLKRHRNAALFAMRDAWFDRYGKMGDDVALVCYADD